MELKPENDKDDSASLTFEIQKCKTETVVIYLDRAEVCRSLKAKVRQGENEIVLKELSSCIDKDSIRVEGKGPATISEVAFQTKHLTPEEANANKEKNDKLRTELDECKKKEAILQTKKHRLRKQRQVLDSFADNVTSRDNVKPESGATGHGSALLLSSESLKGMQGFFTMYDQQAARLDELLHDLDNDIEKVRLQLQAMHENLRQLNIGTGPKKASELSVLLDASEDAEVELSVSYVVTKAKWTPKYDIRVYSNEGQLKIMYYGMIQQATGEDWEDTKLCLSTATPSVGGTVPDLGTQKLAFRPRTPPQRSRSSVFRAKSNRQEPAAMMAYCAAPAEMMMSMAPAMDVVAPPMPEMDIATAEVKESIATTMYEIARRSTVPADNVSHKVSVAIIDLKPTFEYETVPKKICNAFLKAKVKNTSPYALLAGPTNIFLDNNFIAKAELKAVSPQEDFTCSLGVDPAVKVTYKPVNKFREQSGLISKWMSTTYKQLIEIKNTHKDLVKILVVDQLPLSTEEKIKVTVQEPVIKHPEKYDLTKPIRVNRMNNIEWDLEIGAGETRELILKYVVEHPVGEELDTSVTHLGGVTTNSSDL